MLDSADTAVNGLNLFFTVVAALALTLCFFATWLSFLSNVQENSVEFGILRSLGLSIRQTISVYLFEAVAVVLSAFLLGTIVGLVISTTLTLQFNLFTEMAFSFVFPVVLFVFTFVACVLVAVISSFLPALGLSKFRISNVLKGLNR